MHTACFNGNLTAAFILGPGDESDVNFTCEADSWPAAFPHCHRVRSTPALVSGVPQGWHRHDQSQFALMTQQRYIFLTFFLRNLFQLCYRSGKQAGCCHSLYWPEAETQTHVRLLLILVVLCISVSHVLSSLRKLYVALSVGLCLLVSILVLFFLFPRSVLLSPVAVKSSSVYFTHDGVQINITVRRAGRAVMNGAVRLWKEGRDDRSLLSFVERVEHH